MTDSNGIAVPKTKWGKQFGASLKEGLGISAFSLAYSHEYLTSGAQTNVLQGPLMLRDCFDFKKAGTYHLTIETRLGYPMTNNIIKVYYLPVTLDLQITDMNNKNGGKP